LAKFASKIGFYAEHQLEIKLNAIDIRILIC